MDLSEILAPFILSAKILAVDLVLFLVFGTLLSAIIAFGRFRAKFVLELFVTLPLIFPPMACGFLLLHFLGQRSVLGGFLNKFDISFIFDIKGLILAGFIAGVALFVKPVSAAFESFDANLIDAAKSLGKSKFVIFLFVILPNTKKILLSSLIIALARVLGEVGVSLMLGGNLIGKTDTVSLSIYNAVMDGDTQKAMILSLILVVFSAILYSFTYVLEGKFRSTNSY